MPRILRLLPVILTVAFCGWCLVVLRKDLAQLSPASIARSWQLIVVALLLSLGNYALRAVRWCDYMQRLGHTVPSRLAFISYVAGFAYTLVPGKVGEMIRARYYLPLGVPIGQTAAAFFCERLLDTLVMVLLSALLLAGSFHHTGFIIAVAMLAGSVLAALALLPWTRIAAWVRNADRLPALPRSLLESLARTLAATRPLLAPGALVLGFGLGLLAWLLEGIGLGVLARMSPGVELDLVSAVGIYGIAILIGGLTFMPGGLGSAEAAMTALLVSSGFSFTEGLTIALVCRFATLWFAVLLGWIAVAMLRPQVMAGAVK
jgi:uncharacterized protein (TIRG00374 family)